MIPDLEKIGAYLVLWLDPIARRIVSATIVSEPYPTSPLMNSMLVSVIYLRERGVDYTAARRKVLTAVKKYPQHQWCRSMLEEEQAVRTSPQWTDLERVMEDRREVEFMVRQAAGSLLDALHALLVKRSRVEISSVEIKNRAWTRRAIEQWVLQRSSDLVVDAELTMKEQETNP